jgi:hypothetical protein
MAVRYAWSPGARYSGDAQKVGTEIERIRKAGAGMLEPEAVLEHARSHNSVLHGYFEWDDTKAAHQYRVGQAGDLIRAVQVDVTRSNVEPPKTIRAFVSVKQGGERSYTSTLHALSDEQLRAQVLATAWAELLALRRKYEHLEELGRIFAAMDDARGVSGSDVSPS